MAQEPREAATPSKSEPTEGEAREHQFPDITPARILDKVSQDPEGARIVQSAVQQCMIEDQQKMIEELKKALLAKNNPDSAPDE